MRQRWARNGANEPFMVVHAEVERHGVFMSCRKWLQDILRDGCDERLNEWFVGVVEML
jgi:hypothetical protein